MNQIYKSIKMVKEIIEIENKLLVNRLKHFCLEGVWNYNYQRSHIAIYERVALM